MEFNGRWEEAKGDDDDGDGDEGDDDSNNDEEGEEDKTIVDITCSAEEGGGISRLTVRRGAFDTCSGSISEEVASEALDDMRRSMCWGHELERLDSSSAAIWESAETCGMGSAE